MLMSLYVMNYVGVDFFLHVESSFLRTLFRQVPSLFFNVLPSSEILHIGSDIWLNSWRVFCRATPFTS